MGENGELEHAAAILHPKLGAPVRKVLGKGAALIPSSKKRGGPGVPFDIPLGHKDAAFVRSHFDGMEVRVADAPRANEIVVAVAVTDSGRPLPASANSRRTRSRARTDCAKPSGATLSPLHCRHPGRGEAASRDPGPSGKIGGEGHINPWKERIWPRVFRRKADCGIRLCRKGFGINKRIREPPPARASRGACCGCAGCARFRRSSPCRRRACRRAARFPAAPGRPCAAPVHEDEVGRAAGLDQPAVEVAQARRVAGGEAERGLRRDVAQRESSEIMRRMPSGCTPEPAGPSVPRITRWRA